LLKFVEINLIKNSQKLVKLVIIFFKLNSTTFVKFCTCFDKEWPKEIVVTQGPIFCQTVLQMNGKWLSKLICMWNYFRPKGISNSATLPFAKGNPSNEFVSSRETTRKSLIAIDMFLEMNYIFKCFKESIIIMIFLAV